MVAHRCQWKQCYPYTLLQQLYALGDQVAEESLYDMESMRRDPKMRSTRKNNPFYFGMIVTNEGHVT